VNSVGRSAAHSQSSNPVYRQSKSSDKQGSYGLVSSFGTPCRNEDWSREEREIQKTIRIRAKEARERQ
jgi:hypothetical protein